MCLKQKICLALVADMCNMPILGAFGLARGYPGKDFLLVNVGKFLKAKEKLSSFHMKASVFLTEA